MASGMARGLARFGLRAAFGDGHKIIWGPWEREVFAGNPNVAPPGSEGAPDLAWIAHYKGHRLYNRAEPGRWVWTPGFKIKAGEIFLTDEEKAFAEPYGRGFIVIEPTTPSKDVTPNKQWHPDRFFDLSTGLTRKGFRLIRFGRSPWAHPAVEEIYTPTFRHALAVLAGAALYIGPEGGLHHGAAAVGIPAVVIFGGFISPETTGYDTHSNLFTGGTACGMRVPCEHCRRALDAITVDMVVDAAMQRLSN